MFSLIGLEYSHWKQQRHAQNEAIYKTISFVESICNDRPPSHGLSHMMKVRDNAIKILSARSRMINLIFYVMILLMISFIWINNNYLNTLIFMSVFIPIAYIRSDTNTLRFIVEIVALLHDVADHKYLNHDPTLKTRLIEYLNELTDQDILTKYTIYNNVFTTDMILDIIERISFSRQKTHGAHDWAKVLGWKGRLIRNIVSDADKLEAIGIDGINRCIEYVSEVYEDNGVNVGKKKLYKHVLKHYNEKLKHIPSWNYMKTISGWYMARYKKQEMDQHIEELSFIYK